MNNKKAFIVTTSKETADLLKKEGFQAVQECDGKWTFLNDVNLLFDNKNHSKEVVYTDKMTI